MQRNMRSTLAITLISCGMIASFPQTALSNILDEIQVQPDSYSNVARIRFNGPIHVERQTKITESNVILVYFRVTQGKNLLLTTVESISSKPVDLLPGITVSLSPQPNQATRTLELRFSKSAKPVKATVRPGSDGQSLDIIFGESGKAQSSFDNKRYAVTLLSSASKEEVSGKVIPQSFQDYDVFTSQQTSNGGVIYELNLGYFPTASAAEKTRNQLLAQFPQASVVDLVKRRKETLGKISVKGPQPSLDQAQKTATQTALPEVEDQAASLMPKAKEALDARNFEVAINTFNQILLLPPNGYSQDAQELVGVAREQFGELDKAKAEYELYLKLFPQGPGSDRVRQHLTELGKMASPKAERRVVSGEEPTASKTVSGSLYQTYSGGKSLTQTAFDTPTTPGTSTITNTDQSLLRTNININGTYRNESASHKLSFEDDNDRSFLEARPSRNRLRALNYEYKGLQNGINAVIGRQSGSRLFGVPNRFDGATLGYNFSRKLGASLIIGLPVDFPALKPDRKFIAANINGQRLGSNWGFDAFVINQTVDGILDRRAVGGDLSYVIKPGNNISTHIDYDVSYNLLNIGRVQGDFITEGETQYNFYFDRSLAPFLSTTNALYSPAIAGATPPAPITIKELLQGTSSLGLFTEDQIRAITEGITAVSLQGALGFTKPINETWKIGNDFNWSRTGALPGQTLDNGLVIDPQPATGNVYSYSIKGIGANLLTSNDTNVFSLTVNKSDTTRGITLLYNNATIWNSWTFKPVLQIQRQHTETSSDTSDKTTLTPDFTVSYELRDSLSFEAEYTFEHTVTDSTASGKEKFQHHFFSLGYRWTF
jgi:hypothetical protein